MTRAVTAGRTSLDPLGAGALLVAVLLALIGIGALVGLALGSVGVGVALGALLGMPAGVAAVYRRYRNEF
jgi:hypothetical protein